MSGEVVALLEVRLNGGDPGETQSHIEVRGNEEFYLGRNPALCRHHWLDRCISNRHLRIHCVLYEQDPVAGIPPFVYATDVSTNGTYLKKSNTECASSQGPWIQMGRKNGSFLLDDGDELQISDFVTLIYCSLVPVKETELSPVQQREKKLFAPRYLITGRVLGIGGYGKVMVAIKQKTQRQLACKVIDLRHLYSRLPLSSSKLPTSNSERRKRWPTRVNKCFREFDILKDLNHANIISLEKVFWSSNSIYIFQELVTGGDLFSYIEYKGGRLCDVEAAVIVRQILKGVEYLHEHDIVHRDLKPDNILMTSLDDGARVVITDFGNARFLPRESNTTSFKASQKQRMYSLAGTYEFTAPEIHKANKTIPAEHGYSKAVDMWSVGSITVALLSGDVLFTNRAHPAYERNPGKVILSLASKCDLRILDDQYDQIWSKVGSRPKDFIKSLLILQEEDRMSATEALAHPWFSNQYHAAEFDALYERAIRDWQPRRRVFRLVESISKITADLPANGVSGDLLSQDVVSRLFAPPLGNTPTHDIHKTLAASQNWRTNTLLPAIAEEYEDSQFEDSEPQPQSYYNHSGVDDFLVRQSYQDTIDNSLDQINAPSGAFRYADADEDPIKSSGNFDQESPGLVYSDEHLALNLHPHTPEQDPDSSIVQETPCSNLKRHQRSPTYDTYEGSSQGGGSGSMKQRRLL